MSINYCSAGEAPFAANSLSRILERLGFNLLLRHELCSFFSLGIREGTYTILPIKLYVKVRRGDSGSCFLKFPTTYLFHTMIKLSPPGNHALNNLSGSKW